MSKSAAVDDTARIHTEENADDNDRDESSDSESVCPDYGEGTSSGVNAQEDSASALPRYSKDEKKARKLLAKLDLKPIPGVKRVTIRKNNNLMFIFEKPEVYKNPTSDSYIVLGESRLQDLEHQPDRATELANLISASKVLKLPLQVTPYVMRNPPPPYPVNLMLNVEHNAIEDGPVMNVTQEALGDGTMMNVKEEDDQIDYMGLSESDVEVVSKQGQVSKEVAIQALLKNDNDVVNAIMALVENVEI